MAKNHKNILLARFSALGDVAMTLPTVYDACYANPDKRFYFLTRRHPAQVFINRPDNLTVIAVDTDDYKGVAGMWRLGRELIRDYGIDMFLDLHDVVRTQLLRIALRMSGVKCVRLHKGRRDKRSLTRRSHKVVVPLKPMTVRYSDVFYRAGVALESSFRSLYGNGKGDPSEFAQVTAPRGKGEKWLAVAPFAGHKGKVYPRQLLAKVVDYFADIPGWKIFILGFGPSEIAEIDQLAAGRGNIINMAKAHLGIGAELALLSHCNVMLSMDSSNMHLASLVGLRAVSVWGATHPYAGFLGWNQRTADTVQLEMVCRPCSVFGNRPCFRGDYHCMNGIPPTMIIQRLLQQTPSDKP